uniref:Uncharacterized protein n=1 Tax=Calidris pygmaea TaxID=425635 RepID=A0A8C3JZP9_9CHAR
MVSLPGCAYGGRGGPGGVMAAHLKKRVYEEFTKVVQQQHEDLSAKKLRLTKPSKSAALHVDLCKATSPADALQYLLQFARKPVEVESVEGVVRILLEHYYKVMKLATKVGFHILLLVLFSRGFLLVLTRAPSLISM